MMVKNNRLVLVLILFGLMVIFAGCKVRNQITVVNFSSLYQPFEGPEISGIKVFHETDSISRIYIRYRPSSLFYELKPGRAFHTAEYAFSYKIYPGYESNIVLDSGTYVLYDSLYYQNKLSLVYNFPVRAFIPESYVMELVFNDLNTGSSTIYPVHINKADRLNEQNFLLVDENEEIVFESWISWKTKFRIITTTEKSEKLFVQYYNENFPPAQPPFSLEHPPVYQLHPVDQFLVPIENGTTELQQFGREGFFYFRLDTSQRIGLTLYRFHDDYPILTDAGLMPWPLRYLMSVKEFRDLTSADDPKSAVDKFWLDAAGNEDRAIELLRSYYSRVEAANLHFSSYKEGWKTDRGMIYIVFGPPKQIFRRTGIETWVYGDPSKRLAPRFDFIKNQNPYSSNDYELLRLPEYKSPYFIAVDFWRR
jgi:GWxTD domain-containing protein